jgi:hypothetical protein
LIAYLSTHIHLIFNALQSKQQVLEPFIMIHFPSFCFLSNAATLATLLHTSEQRTYHSEDYLSWMRQHPQGKDLVVPVFDTLTDKSTNRNAFTSSLSNHGPWPLNDRHDKPQQSPSNVCCSHGQGVMCPCRVHTLTLPVLSTEVGYLRGQ